MSPSERGWGASIDLLGQCDQLENASDYLVGDDGGFLWESLSEVVVPDRIKSQLLRYAEF